MPKTKIKLPYGEVVECEILSRFKDTYEVTYWDPKTRSVWTHWTNGGSLIFPQFDELIF